MPCDHSDVAAGLNRSIPNPPRSLPRTPSYSFCTQVFTSITCQFIPDAITHTPAVVYGGSGKFEKVRTSRA